MVEFDNQYVHTIKTEAIGATPWLLSYKFGEQALLDRLEQEFPLIEEAGCKIGIGVATGCDHVFIAKSENLAIEDERKVPLLMTTDIQHDSIRWSGNVVVNPFDMSGRPVDLQKYPLLQSYFLSKERELRSRYVAQKNPASWYRTIDKISLPLMHQPKLVIPDIKGQAHFVYDAGNYYPHHNLYYVTSTEWNLQVLQVLLRSPIAHFFVKAYSVKMRGGYLRFQAQNLRRIRLPQWHAVPQNLRDQLLPGIRSISLDEIKESIFDLYHLNRSERDIIQKTLKG